MLSVTFNFLSYLESNYMLLTLPMLFISMYCSVCCSLEKDTVITDYPHKNKKLCDTLFASVASAGVSRPSQDFPGGQVGASSGEASGGWLSADVPLLNRKNHIIDRRREESGLGREPRSSLWNEEL